MKKYDKKIVQLYVMYNKLYHESNYEESEFGPRGYPGPRGPQGIKGEPGNSTGTTGPVGATGPAGATGTSQLVGFCLFQTTSPNSILSICNPLGEAAALTSHQWQVVPTQYQLINHHSSFLREKI
jgi:hypothetical protein